MSIKIKNKNSGGPARMNSDSGGFALLFSVLVSSLLLTIGLSIFSIALKELAISTASRQSIHAFYAADSGREYALYRDLKKGNISTFDFTDKDMSNIQGDSFPVSGVKPVDENDPEGPNFSGTITKSWFDTSYTKVNTYIVSTGHDTLSGDRVERAIEQIY